MRAESGRTIAYEPAIDGLRALSIGGVLLFHACATSSLTGWFRGGNLGVSVFFTLSGFLITTLLVTELDRDGRIGLRRFWTRRIRRLVPASLVVVTAVTVLSATSWFDLRRSDALAATWSVTNWHVIVGGQERLLQTIVGPLGPTWSLAVEEQFYVLLAIGVWLASRTALSSLADHPPWSHCETIDWVSGPATISAPRCTWKSIARICPCGDNPGAATVGIGSGVYDFRNAARQASRAAVSPTTAPRCATASCSSRVEAAATDSLRFQFASWISRLRTCGFTNSS